MSIHDRWRGARSGPGKRWELRYRAAGVQVKRRFDTRAAAEAYDARRRTTPEQKLVRDLRRGVAEKMSEAARESRVYLRGVL